MRVRVSPAALFTPPQNSVDWGMAYEFLHIRENRLNSEANLLLLAIPAVVFFLTLSFLLWQFDRTQIAAGASQTEVLGTESEAGK